MAIPNCPKCGIPFSSIAGQPIACPGCGMNAKTATAAANCAVIKPPPVLASRPLIPTEGTLTTTSGAILIVDAVLLYDINAVRAVENLQAQIARGMAGARTGIGFIGGLPSVIAWSAMLCVIESVVSSSIAENAQRLLEPY